MNRVRLVRQCQSGDKDALGILYQTYIAPMREVVSRYIRNADVQQDILHDGFIIAFSSIGSLKDGTKIDSWLSAIMRNLSLQYLKDESSRASVPLSEAVSADQAVTTMDEARGLTWEELSEIIERLPDGYGRVFRLAVLDGLSHKEIAALLGIAPHSSSSQLTHAKAMLRRMIRQYRKEVGILSVLGVLGLVCYELISRREVLSTARVIGEKSDRGSHSVIEPVNSNIDTNIMTDTLPNPRVIDKLVTGGVPRRDITEVSIATDTILTIERDSVYSDTIRLIPTTNRHELVVQRDVPVTSNAENSDWSLSLAYSGNRELTDRNSYRIPDPDISDVEGPTGDVEVTEKTRHHVPLVIGLSVSRSLTSRWSVETGMRYTYLRSDILSQSKLMSTETIQRIHYIGLPLKFNYRILSSKGFSMYGQGGVVVDIPVYAAQSIRTYSPKSVITSDYLRHIHPPLQWSVEGGVGIQYHFTPSLSLYAEPSLRYYFDPASAIKTVRQEKPFEFTIPIGLRLTW